MKPKRVDIPTSLGSILKPERMWDLSCPPCPVTGTGYWKTRATWWRRNYRIEDGAFYVVAEFSWVIGDPQNFVVRVGGIELASGDLTALDYSYIRVNR